MAGISSTEADAIIPWPPLAPGDTTGPVTEGIQPPTHWDPATVAAPPPAASWTPEGLPPEASGASGGDTP